jgi:polyisoprenoid-binding protein YceI
MSEHGTAPIVPVGSWRVFADRSRVGFRVKKMGLYFVKGRFRGVTGVIDFSPEGVPEGGELMIDAATITTRIPPRDLHLRSTDFLHVKRYPEIWVRAERVDPDDDGGFAVRALLEIHGKRRSVELLGHLHAPAPSGHITVHLHGVIDRHDFEIRARQPFEAIVGSDVELDVELVLEPSAER